MPDERYITLDALLPAEPANGQVFDMPEGQVGGASTMTFVYAGGRCIGHTSQFARVANVNTCAYLGRTITSDPLVEGMVVRLLGEQFTFKALVFTQFFGWGVHTYNPEPKVLLDGTFRVVHAVPMRKPNSSLYAYDRVCLEKHNTEKE